MVSKLCSRAYKLHRYHHTSVEKFGRPKSSGWKSSRDFKTRCASDMNSGVDHIWGSGTITHCIPAAKIYEIGVINFVLQCIPVKTF